MPVLRAAGLIKIARALHPSTEVILRAARVLPQSNRSPAAYLCSARGGSAPRKGADDAVHGTEYLVRNRAVYFKGQDIKRDTCTKN